MFEKFKPLGSRVLVKRIEANEQTESGLIVVPDSAKEKAQTGKVIAVGGGRPCGLPPRPGRGQTGPGQDHGPVPALAAHLGRRYLRLGRRMGAGAVRLAPGDRRARPGPEGLPGAAKALDRGANVRMVQPRPPVPRCRVSSDHEFASQRSHGRRHTLDLHCGRHCEPVAIAYGGRRQQRRGNARCDG